VRKLCNDDDDKPTRGHGYNKMDNIIEHWTINYSVAFADDEYAFKYNHRSENANVVFDRVMGKMVVV